MGKSHNVGRILLNQPKWHYVGHGFLVALGLRTAILGGSLVAIKASVEESLREQMIGQPTDILVLATTIQASPDMGPVEMGTSVGAPDVPLVK